MGMLHVETYFECGKGNKAFAEQICNQTTKINHFPNGIVVQLSHMFINNVLEGTHVSLIVLAQLLSQFGVVGIEKALLTKQKSIKQYKKTYLAITMHQHTHNFSIVAF